MQKTISRIVIAGLVLSAFLLASSCEVFVYYTYSISGEVINARVDPDAATSKVETPTVTLTNSAGDTVATTTASSTGAFSFGGLRADTYTISATKTGNWAFIDQTVVLGSEAVTDVQILGFQSPDEYSIAIFVVWEDDTDIDAYLSFPDSYDGGGAAPVLGNPYQIIGSTSYQAYTPTWSNSGTELVSNGRDVVGWSGSGGFGDAEQSTTTMALFEEGSDPTVIREREVENGALGPETILLRIIPFEYAGSDGSNLTDPLPNATTSGEGDTGLDAGDYTWVGSAEYFLDSFTGQLATQGQASTTNAIVYVTQGSEVMGEYPIGDFTDLNQVSVLRINMFVDDNGTEVFQIAPDFRVVDPGVGISSTDSTLVLRGRSR